MNSSFLIGSCIYKYLLYGTKSLLNQSTALRDTEARISGVGGNRTQTGANSIIGQIISDFSRDRSQIPARIIQDVIKNFLPLAQQQSVAQAGINQSALTASQGFNPISGGRAAQQQNQAIAAQPPEQKSGSGIGQAVGVALPLILSAATANPAPLVALPSSVQA